MPPAYTEEPVYPFGIGEDKFVISPVMIILGMMPVMGLGAAVGAMVWAIWGDNRYGGASQAYRTAWAIAAIQLAYAAVLFVLF